VSLLVWKIEPRCSSLGHSAALVRLPLCEGDFAFVAVDHDGLGIERAKNLSPAVE